MSEEKILAIDLGTTFSAIAYVNDYGKPEIIPNREGDRTTPSVIFFEDEGVSVVGKVARNQAIVVPRRTVRFIKREMGNPSYRFNIDGEDFFPEDLSAIILKKLKSDAESFLGQEIKKVVISVPAYFKDAQREATRQSGEIAGLEVIRIINEPTAAALAYGLDKSIDNQVILVYDFGGGTFDVTIMKIEGKTFTILATDGDAQIGGKDIDAQLVDYLSEEFQNEHGIDLRIEPHTHQDLWDKAEIAKKDLSFRNQVMVTLSAGEKTMRIDLDRDSFEEQIYDIIFQTEECMKRVVESANSTWADIDIVLLAGGSSRIPAVKEMIKRVTGKNVQKDMNPDECVALGAAIQSIIAVSEEDDENTTQVPLLDGGNDIIIKDIASHSLGVKALSHDGRGYINSIIIPKFTNVPCMKTRKYYTGEDNQKKVEVIVIQGEDENPSSPEVHQIGKVLLKDLPQHKAGELVIEVTLGYTIDGVIDVIAKELKSGVAIRETLMHKSQLLSQDIVSEKKEVLKQLYI
jgi:molecular chaperone DnaK